MRTGEIRVVLLGTALALAAGGCLGGETDGEPEVGAEEQAIETECTAADVSWANPADETRACAGPWVYFQYGTETSRSPLCGAMESCAQYNLCSHWVARTSSPSLTYDVNMNCTGTPTEPECEANWTVATNVCNNFKNEQSAAIDLPDDQRVNSATTDLRIISTNPSRRQNRFKCQLTINYEQNVTDRDAVCGCEIPVYPSCLHATQVANPPVRVVTAAGKTKAQVRSGHSASPPGQLTGAQIQPICSTGEDQPSLTLKLDRLLTNLADTAIAPAGSAVAAEIVRRAKLTYELFDATGAAAPASVHNAARGLYQTYPALEPSCGRHADAVAAPCDTETDWRLRFCTRMSSLHVGGPLARRIYPECIAELGALGDAVEAGVCAANTPYIAASTDAHRRLHEKVLVRFGQVLVDPATAQAADLTDVLHLIEQWYTEAARLLAEDARRGELALVTNKFWQAAHGLRLDASEVGWIDQSLYSDLQEKLDDAEGKSAAEARAIVDDAMELTEERGLGLDRAILTAAYGDTAGQPVLTGAPLVRITADALAPLIERADSLVLFHDVGCSLVECSSFSTPTKLSRLWKVLAHLDAGPGSSPTLAQVLAATPGTMAGWKPVFQAILAGQPRLLAAMAAEPTAASDLGDVTAEARARTAAYEATGLFLPAVGDRLSTGVHASQRARVRDHLQELQQLMIARRQDVDARLVSLVDGLVRVRDADTSLAQLEATKERLVIERDDLSTRAASFRALVASGASSTDRSVFEELMKEWSAVEGSVDEEAYLRVDDLVDLSLSGADATFETPVNTTVADIAAHMISVPGRQTISIATDGAWAPTCALRQARVLDPRIPRSGGVNGVGINVEGALTGPEGYTVSWNGSSSQAISAHNSDSTRLSIGVRAELCAASPGYATGNGGRICGYIDASVESEEGRSWQKTTEGRTSTQFSSGIFLPTTPFEAPVGALVVVEMPVGDTNPDHIIDVHLVRGPHTTLVVNGPADLYVVVNDIECPQQDSANRLHVAIRKFVGVGDAAESLLTRMAHTTSIIRDRIPDLMKRGEVLPAEMTEMEFEAKLGAIGGAGGLQVAVDDYPAPMRDLFYKYVAREMSRLEASVRIANLDREIRIKDAEFRATEIAIQNSAMDGYLVSLLPRWTVRGLRLKELRDIASMYATDIRYDLSPLLKLWYPQVLAGLGDVSAVQELTNVDVDRPVLEMTDRLLELGTALQTRINSADTPYPSPEDTAPSFVAVRFPNPTALEPTCADSPSARCRRATESAAYRWATVAQTKALWSSIGQPGDGKTTRRITFEVSPEDVYEPTSGSEYLSCTKSLPVVRRIGLGLTGYAASSLPGDRRAVEGRIPPTAPMAFVDSTGVKSFEMENPTWRNLANVPLVYSAADYGKLRTDFLAIPQDVRGVSPFTTFVFDIPESRVVEWNLRGAKTIDLILEVEAVRGGAVVAVPTCTVGP